MMIMISISLYSFKYHGNQKPKKPQERTNEQDIRNQRGNAHHSTSTSECRRLYFGKKEFINEKFFPTPYYLQVKLFKFSNV